MPTAKKRLSITLSTKIAEILKVLSERDGVPKAVKASELIRKAIAIDEHEIAESYNTVFQDPLIRKEQKEWSEKLLAFKR